LKVEVDNMNEEKEYINTFKKNIEIVSHYGVKKQMPIWIEEMSELIKVICKWARNYDELEGDLSHNLRDDFYEEITDVTICLDQLKYILQFKEEDLMKEYEFKVDRQLKRMAGEENE
jgi:hypothetical protein